MYSWRMLILPCLEGNAIYSKYSFREPWNGPNNSKLGTTCWPVFQCPSDPLINGRIPPTTSYVAVTRPGTVWDDHCTTGRPPRLMVVEVANSNINWMEPKDLTLGQACRGVGDGTGPRISGSTIQSRAVTSSRMRWSNPNVLASERERLQHPRHLPPKIFRGLFVGDAKAWEACEEFQAARPHRINWTNCAALPCSFFPTRCCCFVRGINFRRQRAGEPTATRAPARAGHVRWELRSHRHNLAIHPQAVDSRFSPDEFMAPGTAAQAGRTRNPKRKRGQLLVPPSLTLRVTIGAVNNPVSASAWADFRQAA